MDDLHITRIGEALNALRADIENGGEYPDAEFRIAQRYGVSQKELRQAYDEFTAVSHSPLLYL